MKTSYNRLSLFAPPRDLSYRAARCEG